MGQGAFRSVIIRAVMILLAAVAAGAERAQAAQAVAHFKVGLRILPHGPVKKAAAAEAMREMEAGRRIIVVRAGDTLSSLALRHYGDATAYGRILRANAGLVADRLRPGMVLLLP